MVSSNHSQTLSRGIQVLELLASIRTPLSIAEIAKAIDVHRSIAYRILRTLEDHRLVTRDDSGRVRLGPRLAELAQAVAPGLRAATLPELTRLSGALMVTAFLVVLEAEECVVFLSVEPRQQAATIAYQPGARHPVHDGAPGIAIQSMIDDSRWQAFRPGLPKRVEVAHVLRDGYVSTRGEVIRGMTAVAAPVALPGGDTAAISVVYVETEFTKEQIGEQLKESARRIEGTLASYHEPKWTFPTSLRYPED